MLNGIFGESWLAVLGCWYNHGHRGSRGRGMGRDWTGLALWRIAGDRQRGPSGCFGARHVSAHATGVVAVDLATGLLAGCLPVFASVYLVLCYCLSVPVLSGVRVNANEKDNRIIIYN